MNHPLVDGNKRVAFAAMELFLGLNGLEVTATNADTEVFIYHHLEAGTFHKEVLDAWLRTNAAPAT